MFYNKLRNILPVPLLEDANSILCIQPHPDDNEIGAGATIAKLAAKGCKITYLTATDGGAGSKKPDEDIQMLIMKRSEEIYSSAKVLGVAGTLFLNLADGGNYDLWDLSMQIIRVIREVKPEFVMTVDPFLPYEAHPDHIKVGKAVSQACLFSDNPHIGKDRGLDSLCLWSIKGIAYYYTAKPNIFVDVEGTWGKKLRAIACHKSQFYEGYNDVISQYLDIKSLNDGEKSGFARAEAFKVLAPIHIHGFPEVEFI